MYAYMCGCNRFSTALPSLPCHVVEGADLRVNLNAVEENNIPAALTDSCLSLFIMVPNANLSICPRSQMHI